MKFWHFYRVISRRRWVILGLVAVTIAAIYADTANNRPYYRASIKIMPSYAALYRPILPSPNAQSPDVAGTDRRSDTQLPNLMSLLKSRPVAERTIQVAGLKDSPESLLGRVEVGTADNPGARSRDDIGTDIIQVRVIDGNPDQAIRTANALAHVYASFYQEISHKEAIDNLQFLETELNRAGRNLDDASKRLREFKRQHKIAGSTVTADSATTRLTQAITDRDAAKAALAESQAKLSEINGQLRRLGPTRRIVEGTSDTPMVQQLESQLADFTKQLNDARAKYEDTHPKVMALKSSIDEVNRRLRSERGQMRNSITVVRNPVYESLLQERAKLAYERDGLAARLGQLESAVTRTTNDVNPGMDVTRAMLEGDFTNAQANYTNLQTRVAQARVNMKETSSTGAMRVIDNAAAAEGPIGSNRKMYLIMGALLSLMLGVGAALTLDSLDNRLRSNSQLEQLLGIPVTALIPSASGTPSNSLARITYDEPVSPISEAYKFLRTDLLLSSQISGSKSIMVSTAKPGQGGTNTVANLGIALALDGKRTILVDADMRRPCLHRVFKVSNDMGLSDVLSGQAEIGEVIKSTEVENLLIVPGGSPPSNPSELLGSKRMCTLMQWMVEHADYVLFDTPSAVAFTDAVVLSRIVDGVILVVRAQQVPRGAELQVRNLLNKADANIIGVVLNDVQPDSVDSYYYHSHYYPEVGANKRKALQSQPAATSLPINEEAN